MKWELVKTDGYTLVIDMPLMTSLHENVWNIDGVSNVPTLRFGDERGVYCSTGRTTGRYLAVLDLRNTGFADAVRNKTEFVVTADLQVTNDDSLFYNSDWGTTYFTRFTNAAVGGSALFSSQFYYLKNTGHTNIANRKIPGTDPFSFYGRYVFDYNANSVTWYEHTSNHDDFDISNVTLSLRPENVTHLQICQTYYGNNTLWYGYMKNLKIYVK